MIEICIARDYSETPGARYKTEGDFSGEEFRDVMLAPKFNEALSKGEKLSIDFDGGYGYPTSFLEEAFGGLARMYDPKIVLDNLTFISQDEPALIDEVKTYIENAVNRRDDK